MADEKRASIFVRISPDLKQVLADAAWRERKSINNYVEALLEERFRERETPLVQTS